VGGSAVIDVTPLRRSLLETVAEDTAAEHERWRARRAARLADAYRQAEELVRRAREEAGAQAAVAVARRRVRAEREHRSLVLQAERDVYETFRRRALEEVQARRDTDAYRSLRERLTALAREQLGEGCTIEEDPAGGGLVATAGSRRVDYTLPALVDRVIASLGTRVEELWR
jgi:vacuolar-type H+-ATPase subunit E/Vma4